MDVMMKMTTEDVRRLRSQFACSLSLEQFVTLMKTSLRDRIHDELDFVVGAIELFRTIDVNGDGRLEWDEFAGYMLDAGQAKAAFAVENGALEKQYERWDLAFRDAKTPLNCPKRHIQRLVYLSDIHAIAFCEYLGDVVYVYALQFDQNEAPRHVSTIRLHTAFQEHCVLDICYAPSKNWLVVSSVRVPLAYLSVWQLPESSSHKTHSPLMLRRIELASPQEQLAWLPSLQLLASASVVSPTIATVTPSKASTSSSTKIHQLLLWDLATLTTTGSFDHCDRLKGVTSIVGYATTNNRTFIAVGREDGQLTVVETESGRDLQTLDAHGHGVRVLTLSVESQVLASAGAYAYGSDESTHHILVWRIASSGKLTLDATLRDHNAPVLLLQFVDTRQQLVSADIHGVFRVYSSCAALADSTDKWPCVQVFEAGRRIHACVVVPETLLSDAVMVAASATAGASVQFFDLRVSREREDVVLATYCRALNVVLAVTATRLLLWRAESGKLWKKFAFSAILQSTPPSGYADASTGVKPSSVMDTTRSITAACVDDRERKVLLGDDWGGVRVVNLVNGTVMKALDPHTCAVLWLSYVLFSKRVISVSLDAVLHVYDEDNAVGYYVPYGTAKPQSVLLQSLRFLPEAAAAAAVGGREQGSHQPHAKFEIVRAIGNEALNLVAVLIRGSLPSESFVQVWNFDLSHAQGAVVVLAREMLDASMADPAKAEDEEEITSVSFCGSSRDLVVGTSQGSVLVWTEESGGTYVCAVELTPRPRDGQLPKAPILHLVTVTVGLPDAVIEPELAEPTPPTATFLTADGAPPETGTVDAVLPFEDAKSAVEPGVYVAAADESGVLTTWLLLRERPTEPVALPAKALDETLSSKSVALFQHEEMVMGYEAVAALHSSARRRSRRVAALHRRQQRAIAQWRAHASAVTSLRASSGDPWVLLTSSASGKVKIWSLPGELLGVLDYFATRRAPERRPWSFPVDVAQRHAQQTAFAQQFMDKAADARPRRPLEAPAPRVSVLQERLCMTPQEMADERKSLTTPKTPTRRKRFTHRVEAQEVDKAIREMLLAQTRAKPPDNARARGGPAVYKSQATQELSMHALLSDLPQASSAETMGSTLGEAGVARRRYSMVTLSDLKHALRPRPRPAQGLSTLMRRSSSSSSKAAVHCGFSTPMAEPMDRPRELVMGTNQVPTAKTRLELLDLQLEKSSNQDERPQPRKATGTHKTKADSVLNYHVKLAHAWNRYAAS